MNSASTAPIESAQSTSRQLWTADPTGARPAAITGLTTDQVVALVGCIHQAVPELVALYLYGSRARGNVHSGSDLDLALLLPVGSRLAPEERLSLAGLLERTAGCPVDLAVLDLGSSVVFCKEVVTTGAVIFVADAEPLAWFEMTVLSQYARLNEDRAPVLAAYRAG